MLYFCGRMVASIKKNCSLCCQLRSGKKEKPRMKIKMKNGKKKSNKNY